jgi:predicted Zn-dependent protease
MRCLALVLLALLPAAGCGAVKDTVGKVGKDLFESETGVDADPYLETAESLSASFEALTPEQEYYIGRAVAAEVLAGADVLADDRANAYVNRVGLTIAQASDMPDVFGGYHFFVLDSDECNALAAPGAFIFVTRGLLRACETEDHLAAVLAHEIAHIVNRDGMRAVQQSERADALLKLGISEALARGDAGVLEKALGDIAHTLTRTLAEHGYSRALEAKADGDAVALLDRVGYRRAALAEVLANLAQQPAAGGKPLFGTHKTLDARIAAAQRSAGPAQAASAPRQARFDAALAAARR